MVALVLLIGPIGWAALIFAFPLWVLVVSYVLWSGMGARAVPGRPASGEPLR